MSHVRVMACVVFPGDKVAFKRIEALKICIELLNAGRQMLWELIAWYYHHFKCELNCYAKFY